MSLNPILSAIEIKDEQLLKILVDYCIKCAKTYHPAYMKPVEQYLAPLSKDNPEIVANVFRSASYIPTHNHEYIASRAVTISNKLHDFLDGNKNPVFILRSHLPTTIPSSSIFKNTNTALGSESRFPLKPEAQPTYNKRTRKIYVSPFQFRPIEPLFKVSQTKPSKRPRKISVFKYITEKEYFKSPAIEAIVRFKWYKFGIKKYLKGSIIRLTFFILMMIITGKQISVSSVKKGEVPTADEIAARYLPGWQPVFKT
ncbi:hypothetical protein BGZ65_005583, partial [Modicella reniformis]